MIISELVDKGREALEFERGNLVRERLSIFHGSLSPDNSLMYDLVINFYDTILHHRISGMEVLILRKKFLPREIDYAVQLFIDIWKAGYLKILLRLASYRISGRISGMEAFIEVSS